MTCEVMDVPRGWLEHGGLANAKEHTMSIFESPRFLRHVLWADAASGAATGGLHLLAADALAPLLGLPPGWLLASGAALLVYVAGAAWLASCDPVPRAPTWVLVAGNVAWVAGCLALLAAGAAGTPLGQVWLAMQALAVALLALLQGLALRRLPAPGWA